MAKPKSNSGTPRVMAPKRTPSSPISIGNCHVTIEARSFTCKSDPNSLQISVPKTGKVKISVVDDMSTNGGLDSGDLKRQTQEEEYAFVLANPKDDDDISKAYLQDVLQLYVRELPEMNYAANTGKQSKFLEKCVTNGKYCSLLLKSKSINDPGKVVASITYQIVPSDTQFAETPLAAVDSVFQRKGLGRMLYLELRNRLRSVGVRTVLCWGDKESQGFWFKQGFTPVAEVGAKGKARRLPIKAGVQRALCFPGGSTLMVSHLSKCTSPETANSVKCVSSKLHQNVFPFAVDDVVNTSSLKASEKGNQLAVVAINGFTEDKMFKGSESWNSMNDIRGSVFISEEKNKQAATAKTSNDGIHTDRNHFSNSTLGTKRVWEASMSSLKSKKVKGSQLNDNESDSACDFCATARKGSCGQCSMEPSKKKCLGEIPLRDSSTKSEITVKNHEVRDMPSAATVNEESPSETRCYKVMLMNIADNNKKTRLTKVIEDLGGSVTSDGTLATHVVTGKVRKTLNFCTALCSGAWVVSPSWLKVSFREGGFVDESLFILNDDEYSMKYKVELKDAVLKAKSNPRSLLRGFDVCIGAAHVEPSANTLSAIVMSAGGNVVSGLDEGKEASKMIFLACEQEMDKAMLAVKKGVLTFGIEWFMNCVMRQELDIKAPKFAEAL